MEDIFIALGDTIAVTDNDHVDAIHLILLRGMLESVMNTITIVILRLFEPQ